MRRYDSVNIMSSSGNMMSSPVKYVKVPICNVGVRWMSGKSMRSRVAARMQNESSKTLREIRRSKKLKLKLMTDEERLIYNLRRVGSIVLKLFTPRCAIISDFDFCSLERYAFAFFFLHPFVHRKYLGKN